jgi:hypothetical protein|nr:MAG TPA: hypothetical protein [Caudoviricetes sp.]
MKLLSKWVFDGSISIERAEAVLFARIDEAPRSVPALRDRAKALVRKCLASAYDTELDLYVELLSIMNCTDTSKAMTKCEFVEAAARLVIQGTPLRRIKDLLCGYVMLLTASEFPDHKEVIWMRDAIRGVEAEYDRVEFFDSVMGVLR